MTVPNVWVLDNNLLAFALKSGAEDAVAQAIERMRPGDDVVTVEHVLGELKRSGVLWPRWLQSALRRALKEIPIEVGSDEELHYDAMMNALSATRRDAGLRDLGERACIAVCTTLQGAIFVSHDAGSMRLAIAETARVSPARARAATTSEMLRVLRERGALPWDAVDAIVKTRGTDSRKLPDPSWWPDWLAARGPAAPHPNKPPTV